MKKRIGQFIFDLVVKYIDALDDENYLRLRDLTYRMSFTLKRPLPPSDGRPIYFHRTDPYKHEVMNPPGPGGAF